MGHAYHSNYLVWFEIGRTELLRAQGQSYADWEDKHGVYLPVRRLSVNYLRQAFYDDLLVVETHVIAITRATITFRYVLRRESEAEPIADGETHHVFMDRAGRILRCANTLLPQLFRQ